METTTDKKNVFTLLSEAFRQRGLDSHAPRRKAMDLLVANGLPTSKSEEYRFTPIVRALESNFNAELPALAEVKGSLLLSPEIPCNLIVFINGIYSPSHSTLLDSALTVRTEAIDGADAKQDPFNLLNQSFAGHEVIIDVPAHHTVAQPLAVVHYFDAPSFVFANPRWTCRAGAGSKVSVLEYTLAAPAAEYFNNKHSLIKVGEHGSLDFLMIQQASRNEVLVNNAVVELAGAAYASCYTCTFDGKVVRNNLTLVLDGEGIDAHLHGLYLVTGSSLVDNHTVVDHRKPNSYSNELYKGILDENGKAVFNGKIFVRPDAQKTNAFQSNRNILLSETSNIHTKPQLEIWADDVKCSHGCTTGQLDEEALFYLRSRGISRDAARAMLLRAFAAETLEGINDDRLRPLVDHLILQRLDPAHAQ